MVNWAYQPPEDQTDQILQNYERGQQVGQARERKSAMSAYLPQALGGGPDAKEAVGKIAAVDPEFGVRLSTFYQNQEENARKKSLENWDFIGTILQRPDGSPIQSPEEIQHAKTLAIARGLPADQVNQVTPDSIPQLIQTSQSARQYARQAQQDDLQRRVGEANIRQSDAAANASRNRAGTGAAPPKGFVNGPPDVNGNPTFMPKMNDDQTKALGFSRRLKSSNGLINQFESALTNGWQTTRASAPFGVGNFLTSEDFQQGDQAVRDFINAQLRRESGAVISDPEFANARAQYIPQPGDGPKVLAQKRQARKLAYLNMQTSAGPGSGMTEASVPEDAPTQAAAPRSNGLPPPPPGSRLVQ